MRNGYVEDADTVVWRGSDFRWKLSGLIMSHGIIFKFSLIYGSEDTILRNEYANENSWQNFFLYNRSYDYF